MDERIAKRSFEVSDLHIIRLSRYTYSRLHRHQKKLTVKSGKDQNNNIHDYDQFYLFGYFDGLAHHNEEKGSLQYEECMGLDNPGIEDMINLKNKNTSGVQSWSLVRLESDGLYFSDPFLYKSKDPKHLSDKPFLAIITVTLNPEHYFLWARHHPNQPARALIQQCLESIKKRIEHATSEIKPEDKPLIGVFMSVNYGDICVIIRTSDIYDAYMISGELRSFDNKDMPIRFSTFTTIGIETGMRGKTSLSTPLSIGNNILKSMDKHHIILDLAADPAILPGLLQYAGKNGKDNADRPQGIYGWYNISIYLTFKQFNLIYPLLCHYKLGMGDDIELIPKPPEKERVVFLLDDALRKGQIHSINERLAFFLDEEEERDQYNYSEPYKESIDKFIFQLDNLKDEINAVSSMAHLLPYNRRGFLELMRLVKELYKTYVPMWYQHDSRINIYMIYKILYMVVAAAKSYISKIEKLNKPDEKHRSAMQMLCLNLIDSLNQAVYQINSLAKTLQGTNLQTIQMQNYEIQTQVDLEKYVVAFMEFLREFSASFYHKYHGDNRFRIMPFITMDLTAKKVGANSLFHAIIPPEFDHAAPGTAELLNIVIPSFECLARAYDLLLLLCHEITHSFRFIPRKERNIFIIESVLIRISEYIARQWLSMSSPSQNYLNVDSAVQFISGAIKKSLIDNCFLEEWNEYPMSYLKVCMTDFFLKNVFMKREGHTTSNPVKPPIDIIMDALRLIYSKAQDQYSPEEPKVFMNYMNFVNSINENNVLSMSSELAKTLKICIQKRLRAGTALEEFFRTHDFNNEIKIRICDVDTLLPHILKNKKAASVLRFLKDELSGKRLSINNGVVCADPLFIMEIFTDLKYYASRNLFFDLREYLLPGNKLSPSSMILKKSDEALPEQRVSIQKIIKDIEQSIIDLYKKIRVLEVSFSKGNENDFYEACQRLVEKLSLAQGSVINILAPEENKKLTSLINISKEKITAFAQAICDISYHYLCASKVIKDYPEGIPVCSDQIRKRIIKSIHSSLNDSCYYNGTLGEASKVILTSSQIYTLLSALSFHSDCPENFSDNLRKCFFSFSEEQVSGMVWDFIESYREIVADLGMCAALALDAFGYLKFYVRYYHRVRPLTNDLPHDMMSERAAAVVQTLLGSKKENLYLLKRKVRKYILHSFYFTGSEMKRDIRKMVGSALDIDKFRSSWKAFKDILFREEKKYLKYLSAIDFSDGTMLKINSCYEELVKSFKKNFKFLKHKTGHSEFVQGFGEKCMNMIVNKYFERFDRLFYMLAIMRRALEPLVNDEELKHFEFLYHQKIKHKTNLYCSWENPQNETNARHAISDYFNNPEPYKRKQSSYILKNTFAFILEYYYRNRLAYSKDPTFDDNWIIDLTGGKT